EQLIARLESGRRRRFDVGIARGPWGERRFFEGAGAGLLPDYIRELASVAKDDANASSLSKKDELKRHVALLRRLLLDYSGRDWQISLDGEDVSGRYLFWEAMNIRSVGPVLPLAPEADPADGQFDFVAARQTDRQLMADYLERRLAGDAMNFPIPALRFRR